jgi:hypothetical protein
VVRRTGTCAIRTSNQRLVTAMEVVAWGVRDMATPEDLIRIQDCRSD